jgi:hypothetical protein
LEEVGVVDISLVGVIPVKREEVVEEVVTAKAVALAQLGKAMRVEPGHLRVDIMLVQVAVELVLLEQMHLQRLLLPQEMEEMVRMILLIVVWLKQPLFWLQRFPP